MPLEGSTVRFIDNFSIGTRGSASAEYPLETITILRLLPGLYNTSDFMYIAEFNLLPCPYS